MDYTLSNGYVLDAATGKRMHVENQAVPTAVSDRDLNSVAWSLMAIVEAAGMTGIQFSKDDPASYRRLLEALNAIYAKLDSPAFKGSPTVPTLPVGDNSLGIVNTAHLAERLAAAVQPYESNSSSIAMAGAASVGVKNTVARGDHRHPTDSTRAPLESPSFTGTPTAPTAAPGTNTKQIANTEFVMAALGDAISAGAVLGFAMAAAPTGWLKCNGAAVSRTAYAKLFAAIGTEYGAGNGSTTFNLPDLRGEFIRGWDDGRGVDAGRAFGSTQSYDTKSHRHLNGVSDDSYASGTSGHVYGETTIDMPGLAEGRASTDPGGLANTVQGYTSYVGGSETRPRNLAMLYCIKY